MSSSLSKSCIDTLNRWTSTMAMSASSTWYSYNRIETSTLRTDLTKFRFFSFSKHTSFSMNSYSLGSYKRVVKRIFWGVSANRTVWKAWRYVSLIPMAIFLFLYFRQAILQLVGCLCTSQAVLTPLPFLFTDTTFPSSGRGRNHETHVKNELGMWIISIYHWAAYITWNINIFNQLCYFC